MSAMRSLLKFAAMLGAVGVVAAAGGYVWAGSAADAYLATRYEAHHQGFPIPFPLTEAELAELRAAAAPPAPALTETAPLPTGDTPPTEAAPADPLAGTDLDALARDRAVARGKHLVESRFVCVECHGVDFGGGTMIDDPAIGVVKGPNLTTGKGGVTAAYTAEDWDRKVRHGIAPSGVSGPMPSEDFVNMSDRELSDIISYIRSLPPVDREVPRPTLGPLGRILMATGQIPTSADVIEVQRTEHPLDPPASEVNVDFGRHMLNICVGCHRANFEGGPIPGGPPDWAPAANLSPHEQGIKGWTEEQFIQTLRTGVRKDGTRLATPMDVVPKYAENMSDTELKAMWLALQQVPPVPDGT